MHFKIDYPTLRVRQKQPHNLFRFTTQICDGCFKLINFEQEINNTKKVYDYHYAISLLYKKLPINSLTKDTQHD